MRRQKQALSEAEATAVLRRNTSGVLAVSGADGWPYAVPLSYVYEDGKLFFHCALQGHKLDVLKQNSRVSFCVIDQDQVMPEALTTCYRSVIVFGTARILTREEERHRALLLLAEKYAMRVPEKEKEIERLFDRTCLVEITVAHMSGKQARELMEKEEAAGEPGRE